LATRSQYSPTLPFQALQHPRITFLPQSAAIGEGSPSRQLLNLKPEVKHSSGWKANPEAGIYA